jgi:hypothetical protein
MQMPGQKWPGIFAFLERLFGRPALPSNGDWIRFAA